MVARLQARRAQRIGDDADPFVVGAERHHGTLIVESLFEHDDVALDLVSSDSDDIQRLVENELLPRPQRCGLDGGVQPDPDLATMREDIHGVVLVRGKVYAVRRRWRAELVDLFAQCRDLVAGFVEGLQCLDEPQIGVGTLIPARGELDLGLDDLQHLHGPHSFYGLNAYGLTVSSSRAPTRNSRASARSRAAGRRTPRCRKSHMIRFPVAQSSPWPKTWKAQTSSWPGVGCAHTTQRLIDPSIPASPASSGFVY